jgi:lysophospholipase L1-like esterase
MKPLVVMFFGDSLTLGYGDPSGLGWVGRICAEQMRKEAVLTHYNLGVRRENSADIAERFTSEAEKRHFPTHETHYVFSFGVNDAAVQADGKRRVSSAETLENTRRILQAADGAKCVFVGSPPVADAAHTARVAETLRWVEIVCREFEVPYLDVMSRLRESKKYLRELEAGDGAHPGRAGYDDIARVVSQWDAWKAWFA